MSGQQLLQEDDAEKVRLLTRYLLAKAAEARQDPGAFLEFCMRSEETNSPIKLAPHQAVLLDFMNSHKRGVIMMSRGASKTFCLATYIIWCMGHDPSYRAAIVSSTQEQALKVLKLIRESIETNPMVQLVFPRLIRSPNKFDSWSSERITIMRPPGTKDPTLVAYGAFGAIRGSRLKAVFIDDILSEENVATDDSRKKIIQWVDASVLQTLDTKGDTKAFLIGTPLHPQDILHEAKGRGWASIKMDIRGDIVVDDDKDPGVRLNGAEFYDHPLLKLSVAPKLRLNCFSEEENLFPARWGSEVEAKREGRVGYIAGKRANLNPWVFQTEHMLLAQDYSTAMCRPEWIEECKRQARIRGIHKLVVGAPHNGNLRFMGVDLAIKVGEHHDLTAFFAFEVLPSGHRQILDIDFGRYDLATKLDMVKKKHEAFGFDLILIEDNAAQHLFVEMASTMDMGLPVKGATTGANKAHPEIGLPGMFNEIYRGAWLIPNEEDGTMDPRVESWCLGAVNYVPDKHTKDVTMAGWLAYQCCRKWGIGTSPPDNSGANGLASFMER